MPSIILASALHDPDAFLKFPIEKALPAIKKNYKMWCVSVTQQTDPEVVELLQKNAVQVVKMEECEALSEDPIENNHILALKIAFNESKEGEKIQYTDGDRIIVGAAYFPGDIEWITDTLENEYRTSEYVSLNRSREDNESHPDSLYLTEKEYTRLYCQALEAEIDPAGSAHLFSPGTCRYVLENSRKRRPMRYPHGKWVILVKEGGFKIDSLTTAGILCYESPLQFYAGFVYDTFIYCGFTEDLAQILRKSYSKNELPPQEVLRDYFRYVVEADNQMDIEEWKHRLAVAEDWISFLENEVPIMGLDFQKKQELRNNIGQKRELLDKIKRKVFREHSGETAICQAGTLKQR